MESLLPLSCLLLLRAPTASIWNGEPALLVEPGLLPVKVKSAKQSLHLRLVQLHNIKLACSQSVHPFTYIAFPIEADAVLALL